MKRKILSVILCGVLLVLSSCGRNPITSTETSLERTKEIPSVVEESAEVYVDTEVLGDELVHDMTAKTLYANTQANVRKGPGTSNEAIGVLTYGEAVTANGYTDDGWYRISYNTSVAYVSAKLLQESQPATTPAPAATSSAYSNSLCTGVAKEIFDATNAERAKAGLPSLIWDDRLASPAAIRSQEIITTFSHTRPDGTKCYVLSNLIYGENIARGPHASGAEFVAHWMASEGHKENILDPQYKTIGIAFVCTAQGDTAVQLFGME